MNINTFRGTALALGDCSVKDSVSLSQPVPLPSLQLSHPLRHQLGAVGLRRQNRQFFVQGWLWLLVQGG